MSSKGSKVGTSFGCRSAYSYQPPVLRGFSAVSVALEQHPGFKECRVGVCRNPSVVETGNVSEAPRLAGGKYTERQVALQMGPLRAGRTQTS